MFGCCVGPGISVKNKKRELLFYGKIDSAVSTKTSALVKINRSAKSSTRKDIFEKTTWRYSSQKVIRNIVLLHGMEYDDTLFADMLI